MTFKSSSVSLPHCSLTLPLSCFQFPSTRFQSMGLSAQLDVQLELLGRNGNAFLVLRGSMRLAQESPMGPFREVDQALSPTRRRIEMGRELTVDFKRSPICRAPFLECFEQHRFLFSS